MSKAMTRGNYGHCSVSPSIEDSKNNIISYSEKEAAPGVFESSVQQTCYLSEFLIRRIELKHLGRWTGALQVQSRFQTPQSLQQFYFRNALLYSKQGFSPFDFLLFLPSLTNSHSSKIYHIYYSEERSILKGTVKFSSSVKRQSTLERKSSQHFHTDVVCEVATIFEAKLLKLYQTTNGCFCEHSLLSLEVYHTNNNILNHPNPATWGRSSFPVLLKTEQ